MISALLCSLFGLTAAFGAKPDFDPRKDAFSFNNDTVREYLPDANGEIVSRNRKKGDGSDGFMHSCFLLSRATMQFAKFAVFDPDAPKVSPAEYRRRVRTIFRRSLWLPAPKEKTVIPGYANLWDFSVDHKAMLQTDMGSWRLSYVRVGNFRMGFPHPRSGQALAARRLVQAIDGGELQAVYLARFPKMNHCVVLYDYEAQPNGDIKFLMYDPNYCGEAGWLKYSARERSFDIQERWFYNRGRVNLMRVFLSPFH